ncbi:MAG: mechanosensitive ion channel protein MscS [Omnitrophica WOR_2 bacterium GWA2_45_18]|nr:MAG: mechanosensitive ion channel protein MscS [Omnitrophica WOR_2 bacterium GWA2_45_18]
MFFVWVTGLLFIKNVAFRAVRRITKKTTTRLDDIFVRSAGFPVTLLIVVSGGALVEHLMPLAVEGQITYYFVTGFKAAMVVAAILFADRFINGLTREYADRIEILKTSGVVVRGFVRLGLYGLGFLILLDSFGISVTPILASLGIGSLAVALALQPTLENFFSGLQIIVDKPVQLGHFIKLDSGEEGYVYKISWRSTWIRMLPNNVVVIPNNVLVNSRIINYYYPDKELAVLVEVGVHYGSDLEHVERVTIEVAKETMREVSGGIEGFEPAIKYHTLGDFSIHFTTVMRAREFSDSYLIKHVFIKKLIKRYVQEKIVIPYPTQAVNYTQEDFFKNIHKEND